MAFSSNTKGMTAIMFKAFIFHSLRTTFIPSILYRASEEFKLSLISLNILFVFRIKISYDFYLRYIYFHIRRQESS